MATMYFIMLLCCRERARAQRLRQVLSYCLDNAADRDVWDMADQGKSSHCQNSNISTNLSQKHEDKNYKAPKIIKDK